MQCFFASITELIASRNYFCKEVFCSNFGRDGVQIGGALQYTLEVYCNPFLRSSGGWGFP